MFDTKIMRENKDFYIENRKSCLLFKDKMKYVSCVVM